MYSNFNIPLCPVSKETKIGIQKYLFQSLNLKGLSHSFISDHEVFTFKQTELGTTQD